MENMIDKQDMKWCFTFGVIFGFGIGLSVMGTLCKHYGVLGTPSAMDVYQGKTTLQITYQDSVAIDSVVVFK